MIYPEKKLKTVWDFFVLVVTIVGSISVSLSVVLDIIPSSMLTVSGCIIPAVFIIDILFTFNTAIQAQGKTVTDRKKIARRYLRGWFWIDILAAIPIGLVFQAFIIPAAGIIHLLRLNPLLKLFHVNKTLHRIGGKRANPAILRLFLLVFWILMAAHFIACGWIFLSGNPDKLDPAARYIRAFYWTITTLTTIGYGDITPTGNLLTLYVVFIEILGAAMYGLIIGNIANLIANIDIAKTQYKEKLDKINTFLKYKNIPYPLQKRINNYYDYIWETRRGYDESSVLEDLPVPLKVSVSLYLNKEIIVKVPVFKEASEDLIKEIIMNLKPVVFIPGDYIVKAGEMGFDMFFISKGSVDVVSADESLVYATLSEGQFFGEMALLLSTPRTATIKAKDYCDLYSLDKDAFERVLEHYPEIAEKIHKLAEKRKKEIEAAKGGKS